MTVCLLAATWRKYTVFVCVVLRLFMLITGCHSLFMLFIWMATLHKHLQADIDCSKIAMMIVVSCTTNYIYIFMDFYNFSTVVSRKKYFIHTWQKCPPHLNNVLTLPSENENITFHTFIMHSLNITRCIKLNDRPDGITIILWSGQHGGVRSYQRSIKLHCF